MWRGGSRITKPEDHRVNEEIRVSPVRLIDNEGEQLGIMTLPEALEAAAEEGLDLVEVSPPYDASGNTAMVAASLLYEMLCVLPGVPQGKTKPQGE